MFDGLSQKLGAAFDRLRGKGVLTEADVGEALREVRIALLEADVALPVVKQVINDMKEKAIGQDVLRSITPGQMVIKIVHDHLVALLGGVHEPFSLTGAPPVVCMVIGLQGSGKTTSTAKLALHLREKERRKVLLASTDIYRPAAQQQLEILAGQIGVASLPILAGEKPVDIAKRAYAEALMTGVDVLLLDTAGRLHIDDTLMDELVAIKEVVSVRETLLVVDAMTGQDAVSVAKAFQERVAVTGVVLTRVDGDARGGAALTMKMITGCPIKFIGVGERLEQLDVFYPDRMANRILDMGDVVSLVEQAASLITEEEAERMTRKMEKGVFDLEDMAQQLKKVAKMGGLKGLLKFLPGVSRLEAGLQAAGGSVDDHIVKRQLGIIQSMTPQERRAPKILNASRRRRIAQGAGVLVQDVNRLLKQHQDMLTLMKRMGGISPQDGWQPQNVAAMGRGIPSIGGFRSKRVKKQRRMK